MSSYNKAQFTLSAARLQQLPRDNGVEVAFIGRSNAGKSRAINAITNHKNLARVSKAPGRTQLINVFSLTEDSRLIDLPGYGYAQVSGPTKELWAELINGYLQKRQSLKGLVLVMDCRHPLKALDRELLAWTQDNQVPVHVLLTKADKLRYAARTKTLSQVQNQLAQYDHRVSVQLFSAMELWGVNEAHNKLDEWYKLPDTSDHEG